jgi:hypothetical protein
MSDFSDELLLGWDIHQWAVAIDRVGLGGTRMKDAEKCHKEYLSRFGQNPLEFQLIGVEMGTNYPLAAALFEQVEYKLESVRESETLDSSYGDQTKDDMEYDEAWQIRYGAK